MELKIDDVKATIIRLQGQMDVWSNLYQTLIEAEKQEKKENADSATKN